MAIYSQTQAATPLVIPGSTFNVLSTEGHSRYFIDETSTLNAPEVFAKYHDKFIDVTNSRNFPSRGVTWLSVTFDNQSNQNVEAYLVYLKGFAGSVDLYRVEGAKPVFQERSGYLYPWLDRRVEARKPTFTLTLKPGLNTFLVRALSYSAAQRAMQVMTARDLARSHSWDLINLALCLGIMTFAVIYNLLVYWKLRAKPYLWYVIYCPPLFMTFAIKAGAWPYLISLMGLHNNVLSEFFFASHSTFEIYGYLGLYSAVGGTFFLSLFIVEFIKVDQYAPRIYRLFRAMQWVLAFEILLFQVEILATGRMQWAVTLVFVIATIQSTITLLSAVIASLKGYQPARYFLVAFTGFIALLMIHTLYELGFVNYHPAYDWTMIYALAFESCLLSLALSYRVKLESDEDKGRIENLNIGLYRSRSRLESLLSATRQMTSAHERLQVLLEGSNAILAELRGLDPWGVEIMIFDEGASEDKRFQLFRASLLRRDDGGFKIQDQNLVAEPPDVSAMAHIALSGELNDLDRRARRFLGNDLFVVHWTDDSQIANAVRINGLPEVEVNWEVMGFIDTLIQSLIVSLQNIGFQTEAERLNHDLQAHVDRQTVILRGQNDALVAMDRQKTLFFQNISHELRTPLTLIMGPIEDVLNGRSPPATLEIAVRHSRRLYRLVNQLLDFQKLTTTGLKVNLEAVELGSFVGNCASAIKPALDRKNIHLDLNLSEQDNSDETSTTVLADLDALEKIVFNYLSNAWKFSPDGGRIDIKVENVGEAVRLSVVDQGPGIAEHDQAKLFTVFTQLDATASRAYEGTGLGLALVKELADAMKGKCGVTSQPGAGSTFWVEFPRHISKDLIDILFVDDDSALLATILETANFQNRKVLGVESAQEARVILLHSEVRCVVSDAMLIGEDGLSLLKDVAEFHPRCFRVLMTGASDPSIFERAINTGVVQATLLKPLSIPRLRETIERALDEAEAREETKITNLKAKDWLLADTEMAGAPLPVQRMQMPTRTERVLVIDDVSDMREYVAQIIQKHGFQVDVADSADHAFAMLPTFTPNLIVVDWMMPKVTGIEFIERLRAHPDFGAIPAILLTAKSDDESRILGTKSGASAYLSKPFNEAELMSSVDNLLKLKAKEAEVVALNRQISENILARYLPPKMVVDIMQGKLDFEFKVKVETVTVMFADIVGFTKATSDLGPQKVARTLNEYLVEMTEVIFGHEGLVDKFIGDGIMALFGTPVAMASDVQVRKAIQCARDMQTKLEELNDRWASEGLPRLAIRIGLHQGPVIIGHFGGARRSDFTAIGNTVNRAARIESAAGPGEIFLSEEVRDYIEQEEWEPAGRFKLKGLEGDFRLYRLKIRTQLKVA